MVGKHCFSQPHHPEPRCLLHHHSAAFRPEITTLTLPTYAHTSNKNRGTFGLERALMVQAGRADGVLEAEQVSGTGRWGGHRGQSVHTPPRSQQCCTLNSAVSWSQQTATAAAPCAMLPFPKCQQEHM